MYAEYGGEVKDLIDDSIKNKASEIINKVSEEIQTLDLDHKDKD